MDVRGAVSLSAALARDAAAEITAPPERERARLWASLSCGGCGREFTADPHAVPCLRSLPCCRSCWDRRNAMRTALGYPPQDRPRCYPADYQGA